MCCCIQHAVSRFRMHGRATITTIVIATPAAINAATTATVRWFQQLVRQ
jgi:hypothetical protein